MATDSRPFFRDDEIITDRDGIPHYTGKFPHLMREYRRRVLFAFANLEGEGDTAEKEAKDLQRKKQRFAKRLLDALHGEAFKACEDLMIAPEALKKEDGYKEILKALQSIEKVNVIKKTEAFDRFFDRCYRRKGQPVDQYLRQMKQDWNELQELSEGTTMSEDLKAYFLLKNVNLGRDEKRQILLSNQSNYTMEGFEKALRVTYYDIHEREKASHGTGYHGKGRGAHRGGKGFSNAVYEESRSEAQEGFEAFEEEGDEEAYEAMGQEEDPSEPESLPSDAGASGDDDVYEAFAAMDKQRRSYKESRAKLREVQKNRGFYKGGGKGDADRQKMIEKEKERTRCSACDRIGHWAGDPQCPKGGSKGQKSSKGGKGGKSRGKGRHGQGRAYMVAESPRFFTLGDPDDDGEEEAFCNMVHAEDEEDEMQQDGGMSSLDKRRKNMSPKSRTSALSESEWEQVSSVRSHGYSSSEVPAMPWKKEDAMVAIEEVVIETKNVKAFTVESIAEVIPKNFPDMTVRDLAMECLKWGVQVSGNKGELQDRLRDLYQGKAILQKGCSKKFVRLEESRQLHPGGGFPGVQGIILPKSQAAASSGGATGGKPTPKPFSSPPRTGQGGEWIFRSPGSPFRTVPEKEETSMSPGLLQETPLVDPRTQLAVPHGLEVGRKCPQITCRLCGSAMVLRRNRQDGGLFFGCGNFTGVPKCQFTRKFDEGLEALRRFYVADGAMA